MACLNSVSVITCVGLLCVARQTDGYLPTASSLSGVFRVADNNYGESSMTPSSSTHALLVSRVLSTSAYKKHSESSATQRAPTPQGSPLPSELPSEPSEVGEIKSAGEDEDRNGGDDGKDDRSANHGEEPSKEAQRAWAAVDEWSPLPAEPGVVNLAVNLVCTVAFVLVCREILRKAYWWCYLQWLGYRVIEDMRERRERSARGHYWE